MICRFCKKDEEDLVKYGVRHYAHGRCWLRKVVPIQRRDTRGVRAALDTLAIGVLVNFRPLLDFDSEDRRGTFAAIGMTTSEFMDYFRERQKIETAR